MRGSRIGVTLALKQLWRAPWRGLLAVLLLVAALTPLKTVEPFVVRVDRTTGAVDVMSGLKGEVTPNEAVSKYFIGQYVRAREGWLPAAAEENFRLVAILSAPAEQRRFADAWRETNPERPQARFGADASVEVEIRAISFINPKVASVRYRRTVTRAQNVVTDDWVATLSFAYRPQPCCPPSLTVPEIVCEGTATSPASSVSAAPSSTRTWPRSLSAYPNAEMPNG